MSDNKREPYKHRTSTLIKLPTKVNSKLPPPPISFNELKTRTKYERLIEQQDIDYQTELNKYNIK
jgi:hypothetical protein